MEFLVQGWKQLVQGIKHHPGLLLGIFFLQAVLIGSIAIVGVTYQVKILENARNIIEPLQNANFNAESIQQGAPFLDNMQGIYQNYQSLIKNLMDLAAWLIGIFLILNGLLWGLSHRVLGFKGFFASWGKYMVASVAIIGPFTIISYYALRGLLNLESDPSSIISNGKMLAYVAIGIYYFLLAAFACINAASWKQFVLSFFRVSITRIYKTIIGLLINGVILGGSLYLIYYAMNALPFAMVVISGILFLVLLVLTRLFWIASLQQIAKIKMEEK
ncbi:hypothetical protein HYU22_05150 [Candidatus Woesearchaeota archaeon]|nr:hypothetical protein [Candidatus Woesearchaeota archaeon]